MSAGIGGEMGKCSSGDCLGSWTESLIYEYR